MTSKPFERLKDLLLENGLASDKRASVLLLSLVLSTRQRQRGESALGVQQITTELQALAAEQPLLVDSVNDLLTLDRVLLLQAAELALTIMAADRLAPALDFVALPAIAGASLTIAPAVPKLMGRLLSPAPQERVYVPWDDLGHLGAALAALGARIHIDALRPVIALLMGMLHREAWQVIACNPILQTTNLAMPRFSAAAALLPFGMKVSAQLLDQTPVEYFPERTTSISVLGIRQLLAFTTGCIVVAAQNNVLFSSGAEYSLRKDLLLGGMLRTVIAMPPGLLEYAGIAFCILVIDVKGGNDRVRFVNANLPRFKAMADRVTVAGTTIGNLDDLVKMCAGELEGMETICVPVDELLSNESQLQVERYVVTEKGTVARSILASAKTMSIEDVAAVLRPPLVAKNAAADDLPEVMEVGTGDLPEFAYVAKGSRTVKLDAKVRGTVQFLQALDIVIVVKGSVGKVGIVPPGEEAFMLPRWVAGQSALVLRVRENSPIDARALFVQLRSPLGQELLRGIVSGATMPIIQIKELRELHVIVPSLDEQEQAIAALDAEAVAQAHIASYRREQERCASHLWQLT